MTMMTWRRARRGVMVIMAAGAAVLCAGLLTGAAAVPAATAAKGAVREAQWGRAEKVPGSARLNTSGNAGVTSLSCWSVNNCAAGGYYGSRGRHAFVVAERNGRWGKARQVPGLGALNVGENATVTGLSCASGGYCVAAGYYTDAAGHSQGFVVTGVRGRWRNAAAVAGLAALNTSGNAQVTSVSCPAAGQCAAAGSYASASGGQGFVVSQASGVWGTAAEVPGLAALNTSGNASVASLSCGTAGNCAAGGYYDQLGCIPAFPCGGQAFVVSEVNGVWGAAEEVPGTAALNDGNAQVYSVSCARDGACAVGGYYAPSFNEPIYGGGNYLFVPFVASGRNGSWDTAVTLGGPGLGDYDGYIDLVSCPSAGSCVAVGYTDSECCEPDSDDGYNQVSVAPGIKALGVIGSEVNSVSCPSAGHCTAAGSYHNDSQAFVTAPR
jgi:hypothetical protein